MPQTTFLRKNGKLYTFSFTTGFSEVVPPSPKTDDDFQAMLLWLINRGKTDEAERMLDEFCS